MSFNPDDPINGHFPVRGISIDGENPGIRKELRELKKDEHMWNLYLLGLWQFQLVPMDKQLSYFQIAGIHGDPKEKWPLNDPNLDKLIKRGRKFWFCTHTSVLFLSWHRPYLALFESILQKAMLHVANQFTKEEGQDKYLAAAKAFRMPYWDWARQDLPRFPDEAIDSATVKVPFPESLLTSMKKEKQHQKLTRKDGLVEIDNPLYSYKFQSGIDGPRYSQYQFRVDNLPRTTRYHQRGDSEFETSKVKERLLEALSPMARDVNRALNIETNVGERVFYLLKSYKSYAQFCQNRLPATSPAEILDNKASKLVGPGYGSLEDVHNNIHGMVGGNGHMSSVGVSAFDPIFWLHHTNIDRLVHIWQGLNYNAEKTDTWVTTKPTGSFGSWVTLPGTNEDLTTPLAPFYENEGNNFWTSDGVRDTKTFGYAYPETQSWNFTDPKEYQKDIKRQLDALYPLGSLATIIDSILAGDKKPEEKLKSRAKRLSLMSKIAQDDSIPLQATAVTALAVATKATGVTDEKLAEALPEVKVAPVEIPKELSVADLAKEGTYLEWLVNIKAVKHALGGAYQVHVFMGPVSEEESTNLYNVSPFHVGTFNPLGQPETTRCDKCKFDQEEKTEISGQIPLTIALAERYLAGLLPSLSEDDVKEYLKRNLHWEVVDPAGARLYRSRSSVEGLVVGVASNEVKLSGNGFEFPHYSQVIKVYPEITTKEDESGGRAEGTGATEENKYLCQV